MKVDSIQTYPCFDESHGRYFIVRVDTDEGIYGLGEVGIRNWGGAIDQAIQHLCDIVVGKDPFATEALWQRMFRSGFFPADKVYACAISAIDIALWDIKGKALGLPVYKLLGGPVRDRVVCYPHNYGTELSKLIESCKATCAQGWKFCRFDAPAQVDPSMDQPFPTLLEPRETVDLTVDVVSAVQDAVGKKINLCLDVHTRLDTTHSIELCRRLEPFSPFFIEDPIRSENPSSYRKLARHVKLPIAAGEQWASKWEFRQVVEEELIDYARIDLCIAGGLTEALKIAHWCETHYINIVPHNPLGPVSAAAGVALCMAVSNVGVQEMPRAPSTYANELFPMQLQFEDGHAIPQEVPGLGVEFNVDLASKQRATMNDWPPQLHRRDGSFTNW